MNPNITPKLLTPERYAEIQNRTFRSSDPNLTRRVELNADLFDELLGHIAALELQNTARDRALVSATLDKCREFSDRQLGVPSRHHADAIIASVDREIRGEGSDGEEEN